MEIIMTSNHGDTLNPYQGADIRKHYLLKELLKRNKVYLLESDRYEKYPIISIPGLNIVYFKEFYLGGKPLSPFLDFNPSFIINIIKIVDAVNVNVIQVSFPYGILATKLILFMKNKRVSVVYDAHNVERKLANSIPDRAICNLPRRLLSKYVSFIEAVAVKYADHILAVSNVDKLSFINVYGISDQKVSVIPSAMEAIPPRLVPSLFTKMNIRKKYGIDNKDIAIIFHGTYSYPPNKEAMDLIIKIIAPQIQKASKNVKFILAGYGVPKFETESIKSLGFINDITPLLHSSDIAIVPILSGGGTRIKILDYMRVGLPIVSTKCGIEGIEVENNTDAIVVETVNDNFINSIIYLIYNEKSRIEIGRNGNNLFNNIYDIDKVGRQLNDLYSQISQNSENV